MNAQDFELLKNNVDTKMLEGKRVLITGGTGFMGEWMELSAPVRIVGLNREQYEYGPWMTKQWDYILHFANVHPYRVIECAKRTGAVVLYTSSGAVYDARPTDYGQAKIMAETALLESGIDVRIVRPFSFVGPGMQNNKAVVNYIYDALSGGPIKIRGDNVTRSYMYAADMAVWLWAALLRGRKGGVYEIGSSTPITMVELAEKISARINDVPHVYSRQFGPDARPYYVPHADELERTKAELCVQEWTTLEHALNRTIMAISQELGIWES